MQLEIIKLSTSIQKDRFFISINGGISVYPITFDSEDDAKAFVSWLKFLKLTNDQIEQHIFQMKDFLNIENIKTAQHCLKTMLLRRSIIEIEKNNNNALQVIEEELEACCITDKEDKSGAAPPPKPKYKP